MAANSTINGDSLYGSYYSGTASSVTSSTGITVIGRTKTYNTYQEMLDDKQPGRYAYVIDASGDASVNSGFAYYKYEEGFWQKLFEEESMDLEGGHTHTNMAVINNIGIKDRRPTFGSDFLVLYSEMERAIAKAITMFTDPDSMEDGEIPFVMKAAFERIANKFRYTFITEEKPSFVLEDQTYIVRGVNLTAQLPEGSTVPDDIAIRIIVDHKELAEGEVDEGRGFIVPHVNDTINGDDAFRITGAMDVTIVYDKVNKDWLVIGTAN